MNANEIQFMYLNLRYLETMFQVSTSLAAMAAGATVVLSGAFGQFLGGIWVGKADPTVKKQMIFAICCLGEFEFSG